MHSNLLTEETSLMQILTDHSSRKYYAVQIGETDTHFEPGKKKLE